jgi:hypothetical protein
MVIPAPVPTTADAALRTVTTSFALRLRIREKLTPSGDPTKLLLTVS